MRKGSLNKSDYEDIEFLLNISKSILSLYNKLAELEFANEKYNDEYKSVVADLKSSIEIEENLIDRLCASEDKIKLLVEHFKFDFDVFNNNFDLNVFKDNDSLQLVYFRIKERISSRMQKFLNRSDNVNIGIRNKNDAVAANFCDFLEISTHIDIDYINTVLIFLHRFINDPNYESIKNLLIKLKYYLSFGYKLKETEFLDNNFNVPDTLYWTAELFSDMNGVDPKLVPFIRAKKGLDLFYSQYENLLQDNKNLYDIVFAKIILRTSLIFLGSMEVTEVKNLFEKTFYSLKLMYGDNYWHNVMSIFDSYEKDKELPNIVSLRRKS